MSNVEFQIGDLVEIIVDRDELDSFGCTNDFHKGYIGTITETSLFGNLKLDNKTGGFVAPAYIKRISKEGEFPVKKKVSQRKKTPPKERSSTQIIIRYNDGSRYNARSVLSYMVGKTDIAMEYLHNIDGGFIKQRISQSIPLSHIREISVLLEGKSSEYYLFEKGQTKEYCIFNRY